jgi:hypothetical protein
MLTPERVREFFDYCPDTGLMTWRVKRTNNRKANVGDVAGNIDDTGYYRVMLDGKKYRAHRIAFLWMGEELPVQVDHINGDRADNRWANLRAADALSNAKNAKRRKDGFRVAVTGVGYHVKNRKWRVRINHNGEAIYLGSFDDLNEAITARVAANEKYGFHANHGRA